MRVRSALVWAFALLMVSSPALPDEAVYYDPYFNHADGKHPWDPEKAPITCAGRRFHAQLDDKFRDRGKQGWMTDEEVRAYIHERYENGQIKSTTNLETYNLFCAATKLACISSSQIDRRRWLQVALQAAQHCVGLDCMSPNIAREIDSAGEDWYVHYSGIPLNKDDNWFVDGIIQMYRSQLSGPADRRACVLNNLGELLKGKGDDLLAKEAFLSAHNLFPTDNSAFFDLKRMQIKLGDYEGALQTLKSVGWVLDPTDADRYHTRSLAIVRLAIEAGDMYRRLGNLSSAEDALRHGWKHAKAFGSNRQDIADMLAREENLCATLFGLVALEKGDRSDAIRWFKESFAKSRHLQISEYDLRLLKKLMHDPSLRKLCIEYLKLILSTAEYGYDNPEARALLAQLSGDGTETKAIRAIDSDNHMGVKRDETSSGKSIAEPTPADQTTPQNAKKEHTNPGAIIAIVVAVVIAVAVTNIRKKPKGEQK